jgi:hypothetical protein
MEHYNWFVMGVFVYVQVQQHMELGFGMVLNVVRINSFQKKNRKKYLSFMSTWLA